MISPPGHQPMCSANGRYVIVFNGEVYNHLLLRAQLETQGLAPQWKGHSDTETILALIGAYGLDPPCKKWWVCLLLHYGIKKNRHYSLRDRIGEKPLYYGTQGKVVFASN